MQFIPTFRADLAIPTHDIAESFQYGRRFRQPEHTRNKTECALLQSIRDGGVEYPETRLNNEVVCVLTFSCTNWRMSVGIPRSATKCRLHTKGDTKIVIGLCQNIRRVDGSIEALDDVRKTTIGDEVIKNEEVEKNLTCVAIVYIEGPVCPAVPGAIQQCCRASITVRLVTGCNITLARWIATKCGIPQSGEGSLIMDGQTFRGYRWTRRATSSSRILTASGPSFVPSLACSFRFAVRYVDIIYLR
ncbi:hypothetical protein PC129_g14992 [Phytophthora cactorum]|uniref:Uncharacterized protein n=1 Tax=Phytophthora cactorum TaxID=29920 RepID=A0A8T1JQH3_9STRA|nr:hypothetical protein PC111_g21318 [Phytophthora cactorum]KAG2809380.1 hypothetical protein PC112_g16526 [Phytophthora cactorum]KAG2905195.1 hypothetical protein PC115_g14701 [Phytophthora cactorum]KAG3214095.1 hypothetical protein PC129_g14992 [Phytophthora cactorum]KAG4037064.1 hypothetical protein PC123_g27368 [Phytophthora cactorum]